jgi:ATP-binding cassette subfamily B protein
MIRRVTTATVDVLGRVPIFAGVEPTALEQLASLFSEQVFPAGSVITREGERGARALAFFIIVEGTATVSKSGQRVASLGPGDHFGEIALFHDVPRAATVTAHTHLVCLALSSWEFRPFVEANPAVGWRMLETMSQRLADLQALSA